MKRLFTLAAIAAIIASCGEKIENPEDNKFDFGETGPVIELEYNNGKYTPKTEPITQNDFNTCFHGTWIREEIKHISKTGQISSTEPLPGDLTPFFAVRNDNRLRQYIHSDGANKNYYKDGSYQYDPSDGILEFNDLVGIHKELRIVTLKETEMTGTFADSENNDDTSVLTLYIYRRLSEVEEAGLDDKYAEEWKE